MHWENLGVLAANRAGKYCSAYRRRATRHTRRRKAVEDDHTAQGGLLELGEPLGLLLDGGVLERRLEDLGERRDRVVEAWTERFSPESICV